ncbi:MAG: translation elongation factor-like protein [Candidatus Woesearchaeota archaeon]
MISEKEVENIFKYFDKICVAAIEVTSDCLMVEDTIHIKGQNTDFEQEIESMQIDGKEVDEVPAGKSVGVYVKNKVRPGDKVYKAL